MLRTTAIWNRDSILELLTRELSRTVRENGQLSVMLVGIDHFPSIQRDHGQSQGEAVVGEVAKRLTAALRTYDHVGRYNTEQLLIVAPGYTLATALPLAESLRQAVADAAIDVSKTSLRVTVSISVACLDEFQFQDEDDLLRTLERVLYRTTINDSNRVIAAGKLGSLKAQIRPTRRRIRLSVVLAVALAVGFLALFFVAPAWTCAPFRVADIFDSSELPPPQPPDCFTTADHPSDAILQMLDTQREAQGLQLQRTITCKVRFSSSASAARTARLKNQQWMDEVYAGGVIHYRRHVLLAASEDVSGGTLFTVELCLMPWWTYVNGAGDQCWNQLAFWK
jgi:diguanylate cyclase (GGDEF)-like protein